MQRIFLYILRIIEARTCVQLTSWGTWTGNLVGTGSQDQSRLPEEVDVLRISGM